ncbi:MAG: terpene cyclase/mutase family protein [Planctomycetales bacterium]|nr:terpene cyclase/mutase family protein [Planctomycetales bacterium]
MAAAGVAPLAWAHQQIGQPIATMRQKTIDAVQNGLAFLASRQKEDGRFGNSPYAENAAVVALAGLSFMSQGSSPGRGLHGKTVNQCIRFLVNRAEDSGFIASPGHGPMYGHGFATMFLGEAYGMAPSSETRETLVRAVQLIVASQNAEGGWRYEPKSAEADLSVTICQIMALRAARNAGIYVPNDTVDRCINYVKRCQNPDGGFMYMLSQPGDSRFSRSAAGIVALYSAGVYKGPEIDQGLRYLKRHTPTDKTRAEEYYMYGHYYAAQAMWHAGGEHWQQWYPAIHDALLEQQRENGSWENEISPEYETAMACLILQMPNSYLPIFQR